MSEYVRFIQRIGLVGLTNILISLSSLIFIPIITKSFTTAVTHTWFVYGCSNSILKLPLQWSVPYHSITNRHFQKYILRIFYFLPQYKILSIPSLSTFKKYDAFASWILNIFCFSSYKIPIFSPPYFLKKYFSVIEHKKW